MDEGRGPADVTAVFAGPPRGTAMVNNCSEQAPVSTQAFADRERLLSVVRWGVGLPKASSGLLNRLVGGLSSDQAQQLVAKHEQTVTLCASAAAESPPSPPSKSARIFTHMGVKKRAHTSRPLHSRLNAAKLFADFARKEGFRLDERIPYGKMAEFLQKTSESSLSPKV